MTARSLRGRPTRRLLRLPAVLLLVPGLVAGLAGCGGDAEPTSSSSPSAADSATPAESATPSEDATPTESASPSEDGRLTGTGYALTLPEGWQDATDQFKEYSALIDRGAVNATQAGQPFSDNVNVLRNAEQPEVPAAEAERQFAEELATVASRVRVEPRVEVDGVEAVHLTGRTEAGEVTALTDQYVAYADGAYVVITFSYGADTPRAQREEEVSSMLASWAWG